MSASDPIQRFHSCLERAREVEPHEGTAFVLATVGPDGHPSARILLLKEAGPEGFVFFTNYDSRKAKDLEHNPQAAMCFHWPSLEEQARVEGRVERVPESESDAYFATRPRGSQLGAWASRQSEPVASREVLEEAFREVEDRFGEGPIPRPAWWGGYRLRPERIEFWVGREHRLHDRFSYERVEGGWTCRRLSP